MCVHKIANIIETFLRETLLLIVCTRTGQINLKDKIDNLLFIKNFPFRVVDKDEQDRN